MLFNKTQNQIIIEKVKLAQTRHQKAKGLMFENQKNFNYALVFDFEKEVRMQASLHMMFVFFPIVVLFLNSEKKIVEIAHLKPFQLNYTPKNKIQYAIELPEEKINQVQLNDVLEWK
ncbi:MAG: DUF192 domain-containing protein [Candidatus Diapherotrites archaeon]|nr:DUF192 domain-containing protein [Candidatus Diapherotrites archaeon]